MSTDTGTGTGAPGGPETPTIRVLLKIRAREGTAEQFQTQWLKVADEISRVRGNLRQELMHDVAEPHEFTIVSEWTDRASLDAFVTSPLRDRLRVSLHELSEGEERMMFKVLHTVAGDSQEPPVRVLLTTLVEPGEEAAFEQAYLEVAAQMRDTPGHLREELLHEPGAPTYHLLVEWASRTAFLTWVQDPRHTSQTGPLSPYLKRAFSRRIFDIVARTSASGTVATAGAPAAGGAEAASTTDVLVVGAGPTGLTLALELARRGIRSRLVEKRPGPNLTADKAIGVHCRTMEIWADQGIVDRAIDRGVWLDGQIVVVNGQQTHRVEWDVPDLPYAHLGLPQYETEDLLTTRLTEVGGTLEMGTELVDFTQDDAGVTARLRRADGSIETVRAGYVVGCDGAHSAVRKGLGVEFAPGGGRFPQLFMLCDVEVDWDMPPGYLLRFIRDVAGEPRGMLVCVPLKENGRYRIATMAPPRVMQAAGGTDVPPGFWQEFEPPTLQELQEAMDGLAPPGTTASNLRWASVFRISHGIVDRYQVGRVFLAGDAAHLHPPAGGQGMNTGIQDAYNLGWKLALAAEGVAAPGLLSSYQAERRPAAADIVGRAVKIAFTDGMDFEDQRQQFLHEMQMLLSYRESPLVGEVLDWDLSSGPGKGDRAPDVHGLTRRGVGHPARLLELIAGTAHTVLLYVDGTTREDDFADLERLATSLAGDRPELVRTVLIASSDAKPGGVLGLPTYVDAANAYREAYSPSGPSAYVVRPDGHVGFRSFPVFPAALHQHLREVFAGA